MKTFLKKLLGKEGLSLLVILLLALIVRFYNFPDRVTFWSEQARSLVTSANYIKDRPSLLGQEYFRVASNGHKIFSGAVFNYLLVPLLLVSNYDPVPITAFFAILNVITGFVIYWVAKKLFNRKMALFSVIIFLFNNMMIYHSLFIWNYNLLPFVGILTFYYLALQNKKPNYKNLFILGLLSGLGTSLQILYLLIALATFVLVLRKIEKKLLGLLIFTAGLLVGNLPMVLFDIRHNFYHLATLWQYMIDTLKGSSDASFSYYYLLPFWPIAALLAGYLLSKVYKFNKYLSIMIVAIYIFVNLTSSKVSFKNPTGMPEGLFTANVSKASRIVAEDAEGAFNVAEVLDFDKRAYVLRYYVEFVYGKKPLNEIEYQNPPVVYVLSQKGYNFEKSDIWEINAGGPYEISLLSDIGDGYGLYKLSK